MLNRYFPWVVLLFAITQAVFAAAIILRASFVIDNWPMEGTTRLSFLFLASIFAAGAAGQLWSLWTKEYGALVGVALDYTVITGPASVYLISVGLSRGDGELVTLGLAFLLAALFGVAMFFWSRRFPIRDRRPLPFGLRWSFAVFIVTLAIVGTVMVFHIVDVMPWAVTDDGEVVYGLMFLGAGSYFVYGLLRPGWFNAAGQMAAFLAYDAVLFWPFVRHFERVPDDLRPNLVIYFAVVAGSALIALYYLLVNPSTRLWGQQAKTEAVAPAQT